MREPHVRWCESWGSGNLPRLLDATAVNPGRCSFTAVRSLLTKRRWSGPIAQWLEQRTHNPLVLGSSPSGPTKSILIPISFGDSHIMWPIWPRYVRTRVWPRYALFLQVAAVARLFYRSIFARTYWTTAAAWKLLPYMGS